MNKALVSLGVAEQHDLPEEFMDGVWLRAGEIAAGADGRRRITLLAIFMVGLGAGYGTIEATDHDEPQAYQLVAGADLSPANLLHVLS
ncbi:hypothetical protein [Stakelama marina]|uniref:Uncharacterized protein n=1 Tax=Stakelama marina TaxID=2826939 RepID=A0A8T4IDR8_9SPHN|nr:hypothetical protein [Stakelama marina]MBR0552710.1 hypothetical protein [Stakelama marina]